MDAFHPVALLNAVVYSMLGILIFMLAFFLIDRLTPYHLWKEIVDDKNIALAILVGAMSIGMCMIIAMAVQ
jgi:putative membrane protein